jgi:hypothetical protein
VRDALSALLCAPEQVGVVEGPEGEYLGLLTLEAIAAALNGAPPATVAADVAAGTER